MELGEKRIKEMGKIADQHKTVIEQKVFGYEMLRNVITKLDIWRMNVIFDYEGEKIKGKEDKIKEAYIKGINEVMKELTQIVDSVDNEIIKSRNKVFDRMVKRIERYEKNKSEEKGIIWCAQECERMSCKINRKHIKEKEIPHSFYVERPPTCPYRKQQDEFYHITEK